MSTIPETASKPERPQSAPPARQFVSFTFFKANAAWRQLDAAERRTVRDEFNRVIDSYRERMMILSYSTVGLKSNIDFMLWWISFDLDHFQALTADLNRSKAGAYFDVPLSYLSMTKHSQYVSEHVHEGQEGRRLRIVPGEAKYLFVYPFVKTRPWYLLDMKERQRMMNDHIAIGHKYPEVKINTTYSFGLDDQEFVVAFETDSPSSFLDLVQELRETEASSYTLRDTPMFTCRREAIPAILEALGS